MARYVDGFVLPVPRKKVEAYRRISQKAGKIWRELGALEYRECVGEDLKTNMGVPFPRAARAKPGETVVFSWIVYKSRADRDRVNAKVMKDPRLKPMMDPKAMPFDVKRDVIDGLGVEEIVVIPFDKEFMKIPAEDFISKILVDQLGAKKVSVGENFRFGAKAKGDPEMLAAAEDLVRARALWRGRADRGPSRGAR